MKVAFATENLKEVDAHFGWAKQIAIYEVTPEGHCLLEVVQFETGLAEDGNEGKLAPRIAAISDCAILYVAAIGGSAAARVVNSKIHPIKVKEPERIDDILVRLRDVINGTPPPWLRKVLTKREPRDLAFYEESG